MSDQFKVEYKGHTITFSPSGIFVTTIKGQRTTGPSVDALKRKIDIVEKEAPFESFDALEVPAYPYRLEGDDKAEPNKVNAFKVTDLKIEKPRSSRYGTNSYRFVTDQKNRWGTHDNEEVVVALNTPEARDAIDNYNKMLSNTQREIANMKAALERAHQAIPRIEAKEYSITKLRQSK